MHYRRLCSFTLVLILFCFAAVFAVRADESILSYPAPFKPVTQYDLDDLFRPGCPEDFLCCVFGIRNLISAADVFDDYNLMVKIGHLAGTGEIETVAGVVRVQPGTLRVLVDHGNWSKGDIIGIYSKITPNEPVLLGDLIQSRLESAPFLTTACGPPDASCWGQLLTRPTIHWLIQIKLVNGTEGWVDSSHLQMWDCYPTSYNSMA